MTIKSRIRETCGPSRLQGNSREYFGRIETWKESPEDKSSTRGSCKVQQKLLTCVNPFVGVE